VATTPKTVEATGWRVNFAKPINTDQMVITLKGNVPRGMNLEECSIECSNGFKQKLALKPTGEPRRFVFTFPVQRNVTWIKVSDFNPAQRDGWASSAEVEVWGIDN
jgi:hypothetical protein